MKNEFAIWGIQPNEKKEALLYTKCYSYKEALKVLRLLENKYNCTNCRIQILDFAIPLKNDFTNSLNL